MFNMRHKSGRQRRGSPKNTQGFFSFPSVSGIARRRPALSACRSAAVEALTHSTQLNSTRLGSFVYRDNAVSPLKDVEVFLAVDATTRPVVPAAAALECAPTRQLAEESVMRDQLPLFKDTRTYSVLSRVGPSSSLSPRARAPHQSTSR